MKKEELRKWDVENRLDRYIKRFEKEGIKAWRTLDVCSSKGIFDYCFANMLNDNIYIGNQKNVTEILDYMERRDGKLDISMELSNGCNGEDVELDNEDKIYVTKNNLVDYINNKRWEEHEDFEWASEYATEIWFQINITMLRYNL